MNYSLKYPSCRQFGPNPPKFIIHSHPSPYVWFGPTLLLSISTWRLWCCGLILPSLLLSLARSYLMHEPVAVRQVSAPLCRYSRKIPQIMWNNTAYAGFRSIPQFTLQRRRIFHCWTAVKSAFHFLFFFFFKVALLGSWALWSGADEKRRVPILPSIFFFFLSVLSSSLVP